jgi:polyisoprenoid-binding protein YceI
MTSAVSTPTTKTTWQLDPGHSSIGFSAKHMMITTVRGRFNKVDVALDLDVDDITNSSVEAVIDAASLYTGEERRDGHLKSADFLEVETYPTITFKSKRVEKVADDQYKLVGDLTIRDITKEVTLDTTFEGRGKDPWGGERVSFTARTAINRKDWGLTWNVAIEAGSVLVGEVIKIELDIQAIKQ